MYHGTRNYDGNIKISTTIHCTNNLETSETPRTKPDDDFHREGKECCNFT